MELAPQHALEYRLVHLVNKYVHTLVGDGNHGWRAQCFYFSLLASLAPPHLALEDGKRSSSHHETICVPGIAARAALGTIVEQPLPWTRVRVAVERASPAVRPRQQGRRRMTPSPSCLLARAVALGR
jgi:hypothetical protein